MVFFIGLLAIVIPSQKGDLCKVFTLWAEYQSVVIASVI